MTGLIESIEKAIVKQYRKRVARRLFKQLNSVIAYGPFKGMRFASGSHLSASDLALKATGLYEVEIRDWMLGQGPFPYLINLGAGDGYYPVAMVLKGCVTEALAFELKQEGRSSIAANAHINGVSGNIKIFGAAGTGLTQTLRDVISAPSNAIFLCDIEGAEFDVIDDSLIDYLSASSLVVELHPFAVSHGFDKQQALVERLSATHTVDIIKAKPRNWAGISEIEALHDLDRALVTTEGRKCLATWLLAVPHKPR